MSTYNIPTKAQIIVACRNKAQKENLDLKFNTKSTIKLMKEFLSAKGRANVYVNNEDQKKSDNIYRDLKTKYQPGSIIFIKRDNKIHTFYWPKEMDYKQFASEIYSELEYWLEAESQADDKFFFGQDVIPIQDTQIFRFQESGNCMLTPIINRITFLRDNSESNRTAKNHQTALNKIKKLENDFIQNGASQEQNGNIQQLCDAILCKIKIYNHITREYKTFKPQKSERKAYKFQFQNTQLNHVDYMSNNKPEQIFVDNIQEVELQCQQKQAIYRYKRCNGQICQINDGVNEYIDESYNKLLEAEKYILEQCDDLTVNLTVSNSDNVNYQIEFLQNSPISSGTKMFQNILKDEDIAKLKHIDMINSYSQFINLPKEYQFGIPYITQFRKVTSIDFAIKHNGLYMIKITRDLPKFIELVLGKLDYYVLYSHYLLFLKNNNVKFNIIVGMYGNHQKHLNFDNKECFQKYFGRKAYYTAFTKMAITKNEYLEYFHCESEDFAKVLIDSYQYKCKRIDYKEYACIVEKKKDDILKTKMHVCSYILQSQQINMMLQLQKMDTSKIVNICVDDIYYIDHEFQKLDIFREKETEVNTYKTICNLTQTTFLKTPYYKRDSKVTLYEWMFEDLEKEPIYYQKQLWQAPRGFGKSYKILNSQTNLGMVYVTLTNLLVDDMKSKFSKKVRCYTVDKFLSKAYQHKIIPNTIIIDEATLIEHDKIEQIKEKFFWARIYVLGDKLQLCDAQNRQNFKKQLYDKILTDKDFEIDFRALNCPKLQNIKKQIRKAQIAGKNEEQIFQEFIVPNSKQTGLINWVDNYNTQKIIVATTNEICDKMNKFYPTQEKYRVQKCFVANGQKYRTGQILYTIPEGLDIQKQQKLKEPYLKRTFCFTCHSLQGMTFQNQMLIIRPTLQKAFSGYCYTAISRLQNIDQLYTLI